MTVRNLQTEPCKYGHIGFRKRYKYVNASGEITWHMRCMECKRLADAKNRQNKGNKT